MDWATRVKVAAGSARGIAYLHEDCKLPISLRHNLEDDFINHTYRECFLSLSM